MQVQVPEDNAHMHGSSSSIPISIPNPNALSISTGGDELSAGSPGTMAGVLPEQRIFPGVVHEKARRDSILSSTAESENQGSVSERQ